VLDHATRDGLDNLMSIVGGKLTTCRQMAEALVDRLAARMGVTTPCTTATEPLPGAEHGNHHLAAPLARVERQAEYGELLCECELVTTAQVRGTVAAGVDELEDLRRKLRVGYGPCQGAFCVWRAAGVLVERREAEADGPAAEAAPAGAVTAAASAGDPITGLSRFVEERWRGQHTTIWGDQARQLLLNQAIYRGIFALEPDAPVDEAVELGRA
jgi:glycerol-3-phosphate dehydrogenase